MAERPEPVEAGEEGEVVVGSLGEAEPGVDDHAVGGDAALQHGVHARAEFVDDLGDDVLVRAFHVAALQQAAPVHDDEGGAGVGDHGDHAGVGETAADIVDERGARREGLLGDGGAHGVDGDRDALGGEPPDHGDDALEFLGLVHSRGTGAGGLPADVDQVGALSDQVEAVLDGGRRVEPAAAVGEGVGRHVHDAHDRAAAPVGEARDVKVSAPVAHMFSVGPGRGREAPGSGGGGRKPAAGSRDRARETGAPEPDCDPVFPAGARGPGRIRISPGIPESGGSGRGSPRDATRVRLGHDFLTLE